VPSYTHWAMSECIRLSCDAAVADTGGVVGVTYATCVRSAFTVYKLKS